MVIGLAFKGWPETNDTRFSVGKDLAMALKDMGYSVRVRDYVVSKEDITKIGFLDYDPENDSVNAIFIMNNHPSNYKFELEKILKKSKDSIFIFDGFGLLNKNQILAYESIRYSTLGYYDNGNINNES